MPNFREKFIQDAVDLIESNLWLLPDFERGYFKHQLKPKKKLSIQEFNRLQDMARQIRQHPSYNSESRRRAADELRAKSQSGGQS